jgi:hypothetical protein
MGRKPAPQPLMLAVSSNASASGHDGDPPTAETPHSGLSLANTTNTKSPNSPRSPSLSARFSPQRTPDRSQTHTRQTSLLGRDAHNSDAQQQQQQQSYPSISTALEPRHYRSTATAQTYHPPNDAARKTKAGFFHFSKSSKASNNLSDVAQYHDPDSIPAYEHEGPNVLRKGGPPAPSNSERPPLRTVASTSSRTDTSQSPVEDRDPAAGPSSSKKTKPKPFGLLGRTRSMRDKERERDRDGEMDGGSPAEAHIPLPVSATSPELQTVPGPPKTAPVAQDRSFREMMGSTYRNQSEDRAPSREGPREVHHRDRDRDRDHSHSHKGNTLVKENGGGSTFLSGLRDSSTRAAGILSKGFFGRSTRTLPTEKEPVVDDEHYVLKVINLPLVEQTRLTRISKRLEQSRDKTEFWMPAFPWRAIDYLNYKGCDVEGLYRVPGSGPQVKKWQRRFDERKYPVTIRKGATAANRRVGYDVNLFDEDDLYDINIIGSMLKAWLRELPDELFPKEAQERIARECAGSEQVPQMLIDELSNLSPFNYYLLFAITCHLSLLLAHSDKNKMDFRNLCICFQPCMKIDAFCFKFLVCDWRECWQGCKNEAKYIEEEYTLFAQPPPRGLTEPQQPQQTSKSGSREQSREPSADGKRQDRSSPVDNTGQTGAPRQTDRTKKSSVNDAKSTPKKKPPALLDPNTPASTRTPSASSKYGVNGDRELQDSLRPLSPIKPLSPLGL